MGGTVGGKWRDLSAFVAALEATNQLVRVDVPVDPDLEITEICQRLLAQQGPAVLFTHVVGSSMPVVANLFGTEERVAMAIGRSLNELEQLGEWLAELRQPTPPTSFKALWALLRRIAPVRHMPLRWVRKAPCQQLILSGEDIDLTQLPIQTCWPGDVAPLLTWPLVITRGPHGGPVNIGVYRMQLIGKNRLIMRWLRHRGGAQHARQHEGPMPVAVAIGADPALLLAAVTPLPETMSEYGFAGLLRGGRIEVVPGVTVPLPVPAQAEIILEGTVDLTDTVDEGPFGDHTGYYNDVERFPVFTVNRMTMRRKPLFLTTFTGRPPDEPAILALALNRIFVPLLKQQFPEITAFHLPMEACSYRMAIVAIRKQYPGHAFRIMAGIWGFLRQFLYTKYIIVVDESIPVHDWHAVMAALGRHVDGRRDLHVIGCTPIDYLDFASPWSGLGAKMGIDATLKVGVEQTVVPPRPAAIRDQAADWPAAIGRMFPYVQQIERMEPLCMTLILLRKQDSGDVRRLVETIWRTVPPGAGAELLWVADDDIAPGSWRDLIWAWVTRTDPMRDLLVDEEHGRFAMDATGKLPSETMRPWGQPVCMDEAVIERVSQRWPEYRLPGTRLEGEETT
ncbi:MAG: UbiD family decarboxylase [Magnetococcales bacterium]|nr:UbiD family decarboxylase [Magnetococcales bacterium]